MKFYIDQEDLNRIETIEAKDLKEAREKINYLIGLTAEDDNIFYCERCGCISETQSFFCSDCERILEGTK